MNQIPPLTPLLFPQSMELFKKKCFEKKKYFLHVKEFLLRGKKKKKNMKKEKNYL